MSHSQFHCTGRVYLDMHGLIFETSICYWQDQPGREEKKKRATQPPRPEERRSPPTGPPKATCLPRCLSFLLPFSLRGLSLKLSSLSLGRGPQTPLPGSPQRAGPTTRAPREPRGGGHKGREATTDGREYHTPPRGWRFSTTARSAGRMGRNNAPGTGKGRGDGG